MARGYGRDLRAVNRHRDRRQRSSRRRTVQALKVLRLPDLLP